jgi:hypothetical protein
LVLTQIALQHYDQAIDSFGGAFVWPLAARNLCLLAYLWLVCAPIVRGSSVVDAEVGHSEATPL